MYKLSKIKTPEITKEVMTLFGVNEETADRILAYCNTFAMEKMKKWTSNMRRLQKAKAEEIYLLTKAWKKREKTGISSAAIISDIEKKILELCVSNE